MEKKAVLISLIIIVLTACSFLDLLAQLYSPDDAWKDAQIVLKADKSKEAQNRMNWWQDARFGMFIHWNPSSVAGSEISWSKQFYEDNGETLKDNPRPDPGFPGRTEHQEWLSWFQPAVPGKVYEMLHKSFYPGMFDPDTIVHLAKQAGMKYIIMVAKHHDGFCMWDSKSTDFDIMNTPYSRDILGEMAEAAHRAGLKFGIYYSQRDWHHPDCKPGRMDRYNLYMREQLEELLTSYGEISTLYFDAEEWKTWDFWEGDKLFKLAHRLQPGIIINNRCGVPADYSTPEQNIGNFDNARHWESCMTLTSFWSWHGFQTPVISAEECIKYLSGCAGGDGNLLLNIGPMPTGQVDPREASRLKRIGQYLSAYGEAIYGTRGGPFLPDSGYVSTYKGDKVYIHVYAPANPMIELPGIDITIIKADILKGPEISVKQSKSMISFTIPKAHEADPVTIVKLTLDQPLNENQIPYLKNQSEKQLL